VLLFTLLAFAPDNAIELDGDGDYLSAEALEPGSAFTVEGWVQWDAFHPNGCCNMLIEAVDSSGYNAFSIAYNGSSWQVEINDDSVSEGDSCAAGVALCVEDSPATGTPIHVAAVVDGGEVGLFLDGILVGSADFAAGPTFSGHTWIFGADSDGAAYTSDNIIGSLDEWRIWDSARSEPEIQCLKDWGLTGMETGLLAHWAMNEGVGNTTADSTGNGWTSTLNGDPTWFASPMPLATSTGGDIGCWDFDGDGETPDAGDCNDTDESVNSSASEIWYDGTDQDCDGNDDDQDLDGYGVATDCDDTDPNSYPGAEGLTEDCEPIDSGTTDTAETDTAETDTAETQTSDTGQSETRVGDSGSNGENTDSCSCAARPSPAKAWWLVLVVGAVIGRRKGTRRSGHSKPSQA
jgi:MYXO-CTERM domain-containing protein